MSDAITREDVIRMAKESGFKACVGTTDKEGNYHPFVNALGKDIPIEWLERFAALAALRAQPASQYLCNGTPFKVAVRNGDAMLPYLPDELGGRWVALVAAEDDCHLRAQPDHSELVKRLRNFDFGSSDVDQWIEIMDEAADALDGKAIGETMV